MEVLRAMLSMHRSPRKDEDGEEYDNAGSQNEIQGSPRVLTIDQVCVLLLLLLFCFRLTILLSRVFLFQVRLS